MHPYFVSSSRESFGYLRRTAGTGWIHVLAFLVSECPSQKIWSVWICRIRFVLKFITGKDGSQYRFKFLGNSGLVLLSIWISRLLHVQVWTSRGDWHFDSGFHGVVGILWASAVWFRLVHYRFYASLFWCRLATNVEGSRSVLNVRKKPAIR